MRADIGSRLDRIERALRELDHRQRQSVLCIARAGLWLAAVVGAATIATMGVVGLGTIVVAIVGALL